MRCWSSMIPWFIFTRKPKLQWIVCLYNFQSVRRFQEFWQTSVPSPEKFLFCADRIESIEWQDLEQRQITGDCSVIHIPHWGHCDPPLSCHRTFLLEIELRQCVFCKDHLSFWLASRLRNFGLLGSEYKYRASLILIPLSYDVPNLSPEKCVRVHALLCHLHYLSTLPTIQEDLANGRPHLDCQSLFLILCGFLKVMRTTFVGLVGHFALELDLL